MDGFFTRTRSSPHANGEPFNENEKNPFHIAPKYLCMKILFGHSAVQCVFSSRSILAFFGYRKSTIPGVLNLFGACGIGSQPKLVRRSWDCKVLYLRFFVGLCPMLLFRIHVKTDVVSRRTLGKLVVWSWSAEQVSSTWAGQCRACYYCITDLCLTQPMGRKALFLDEQCFEEKSWPSRIIGITLDSDKP